MNLKQMTLAYATLKALADIIKDEIDGGKSAIVAELKEMDVPAGIARTPDGTKVAVISLVEPSAKAEVSPAFEAWIREAYPSVLRRVPEQVIPAHDVIDGAMFADYLDGLTWTGSEYVDDCGETPPGLTRKVPAPYPSCKFAPNGRKVIADAWRMGEIDSMLPKMLEEGDE